MRFMLAKLGLRGVAVLVLVVIVGAVVGVGRLVSGAQSEPPFPEGNAATSTIAATAGDDGVRTTPSIRLDVTVIKDRATEFMDAWLSRGLSPDRWHKGLAGLSTKRLVDNLVGVDPKDVPATRVIGKVAAAYRSTAVAEAVFTVDTGTVTLTLLLQDAEWLVDAVDWDRA